MIQRLRSFDNFGVSYKQTVFGHEKYKTIFGLFMTGLGGIIVVVAIILFGSDFFYKKNPRTNSLIKKTAAEEIKYTPMTNLNFTLMWQLEDIDGFPIPEEEAIFFPRFQYQIYKKNDQNNFATYKSIFIKSKRCANTKTVENADIVGYNLKSWKCLDWEDMSAELGEAAYLGGLWSNDHLVTLRMFFQTCPFDADTGTTDLTKCSTFDQITDYLNKKELYFSFVVPDYNFDMTNFENPITNKYNLFYWKASSGIFFKQSLYWRHVTLFDDKGWIFEDINEVSAVEYVGKEESISLVQASDFKSSKNQNYFQLMTFFQNDERNHTRSFMKIQELAANVGGIIKVVMMIFKTVTQFVARKMVKLEVLLEVKKLDRIKINKDKRPKLSMNNNSVSVKEDQQLPVEIDYSFNNEIKEKLFATTFKKMLCCGNSKLRDYLNEEERKLFGEFDLVAQMKKQLQGVLPESNPNASQTNSRFIRKN